MNGMRLFGLICIVSTVVVLAGIALSMPSWPQSYSVENGIYRISYARELAGSHFLVNYTYAERFGTCQVVIHNLTGNSTFVPGISPIGAFYMKLINSTAPTGACRWS